MSYDDTPANAAQNATHTAGHAHDCCGVGFNWWGLFLVVAGGLWLLGTLGLIRFSWSFIGPLALITVGLTMFLGQRHRHP